MILFWDSGINTGSFNPESVTWAAGDEQELLHCIYGKGSESWETLKSPSALGQIPGGFIMSEWGGEFK